MDRVPGACRTTACESLYETSLILYVRERCVFGTKDSGSYSNHDSGRRLPAHFVPRLRYILTMLDEARRPKDMDRPGLRLHPLKGDRRGQWSAWVSGNWRIVFRFEEGEVVDVDLLDYHGG